MLEFACPRCGKVLELGEKYTSTVEVCGGCGESVWTPALPPLAEPDEDEYEPAEGAGDWLRLVTFLVYLVTTGDG